MSDVEHGSKIEHERPVYKWNLYTNYDATVEAIRKIEGEGWESDPKYSNKNMGLKGAMDFLNSDYAKEFRQEHPGERGDYNFMLYGAGGWRRYFVYQNGDVVYSSMHGRDPKVQQRVTELGIEIFR